MPKKFFNSNVLHEIDFRENNHSVKAMTFLKIHVHLSKLFMNTKM